MSCEFGTNVDYPPNWETFGMSESKLTMQSLDAINLMPVWVNPDHLASSAKILLAGHKLKVLGVVDGSELVGIITSARANAEGDQKHVRDFMQSSGRPVDVSSSLRDVAERFYDEDLDFIPVVDGERFKGVVTPNMLLKELARSYDPLTNLSWSDTLREWGVNQLKDSTEITILFIDLDDFGSYNKRYGHIVGDRVLQEVVKMLKANLDTERDQLVRYGGDEFAIGTTRDQADALMLAERLRRQGQDLRVDGSSEPVSFSIGVQGGKRSKERENVHYAATLDNLINLASKSTQMQKERKKGASATPAVVEEPIAKEEEPASVATTAESGRASENEQEIQAPSGAEVVKTEEALTPETQAEFADASDVSAPVEASAPEALTVAEEAETQTIDGPLEISDVVADAVDANSVTQVTIRGGSATFHGICPRKGGSVIKSVALATANAVAQMRPDVKLEIREVNLSESETGVRFISVIGTSVIDGEEHPIGGVGSVGRNLYLTVAEATLQAYTNLETIRENM